MAYSVSGPGRKQTITERGWYAPPYTACRFAVIAQIAVRMGYELPLERYPEGVENAVYDLQLAGDRTPHNGSTMAQGQKAIRALLPGAPFFFGVLSDTEMFEAVGRGATVGFAADCGNLPRYLKNFIGQGYDGGHYLAIDGVYEDGTVDLSDPMYRPARAAKPRRIPWVDIKDAILRNAAGAIYVTFGYADEAYLLKQRDAANAQLGQALEDVTTHQAEVDALNAQIAALHG